MWLLGGLAVYALAPSVRSEPLARRYRDYDVAVPAKRGLRRRGFSRRPASCPTGTSTPCTARAG